MPTHIYECDKHGEFEEFRHMGETGLGSHPCPTCQRPAPKKWTGVKTYVQPPFEGGWCEALGAHVNSRSAERERIKEVYESSEGKIVLERTK